MTRNVSEGAAARDRTGGCGAAVGELQRWLDKLRKALDTGSLYEAEADYQVIAVLAMTTAEQILRVLRESGELREASGRGADQVEAQRRIHVNPFEHQRED